MSQDSGPALGSILLSEFASKYLAAPREDFVAKFTDPFLVVEKGQSGTGKDFHTLSPEEDTRKTQPGGHAPVMGYGEGEVHMVRKSGRNAFRGMVTVGRASNNDVVVEHGSVSKLHAVFKADLGAQNYTVKDVGSTNGTFRKGQSIGQNNAVVVESGDTFNFGGSVMATFFTPDELYDYVELLKRTGKL